MKKTLITLIIGLTPIILYSQWFDLGTIMYATENIGIGTTSPTAKFDVRPNGGTASVNITGTSDLYPRISMGGTSTTVAGVFNRITTGANFYFGENTDAGSSYFRGTGVFGIGTDNVTSGYKLQVAGKQKTLCSTCSSYVDLLPETSSANTSIEIGSATNTSQIDFKGSSYLNSDFRGRIKYIDGTGFAFQVAGGSTNKVVIDESGFVGIGVAPTWPFSLHVEGGYSRFTSGANGLYLDHGIGGIQLSGAAPRVTFYNTTLSAVKGEVRYSTSGMDFYTGGNSNIRMRIQEDGKVVIGDPSTIITSSPQIVNNYQLFVANGIITERLKVALKTDAVNWSDYVFAPDYKLMPLDSVKMFVEQNCHLPGMPSADEVYKDGIDVAQMDALLLKQIEELWLQIMLLKKENEDLRNSINKQEEK